VPALGRELQVGTAKGHDPRVRARARGDRQAIGPGARAEHGVRRFGGALRMAQEQRAPLHADAVDTAPGRDRGSRRAHVLRVRAGDRPEVHDAGLR
jgi:hypothetical protein